MANAARRPGTSVRNLCAGVGDGLGSRQESSHPLVAPPLAGTEEPLRWKETGDTYGHPATNLGPPRPRRHHRGPWLPNRWPKRAIMQSRTLFLSMSGPRIEKAPPTSTFSS